jgi:hypothetical protein
MKNKHPIVMVFQEEIKSTGLIQFTVVRVVSNSPISTPVKDYAAGLELF